MFSASTGSPHAERPWGVFARRDLVARRHVYRDEITWVVKDPIRLEYFYFRDEEFAVLNWLDGRTSPREIQDRFAARFTPGKLTRAELHQFVHRLHASGLVVADAEGQGQVLIDRKRKERRWARVARLSNILSMRFRGVDPDRFLTWLYGWMRWAFTPAALAAALVLFLSAVTLVTLHWDDFRRELPSSREALTPGNLLAMAVVLCVVKVLHEFGHGLSCKHFGGEVHELGAMLLVLTPCLYCNVSDSSLLPSKWRRAAIAFAGIYVELLMASLATFVWWFSRPGTLHLLAISTMVYCSVSTVVFNGNPLMKYDGYYVLADLIEVPNLRARASSALRRLLLERGLGIECPLDNRTPTGWAGAALWIYAILSEVYRWIVTASVLWFLHVFLAPYRLEVFGHLLAAASIAGLVLVPVWRIGKFLNLPGRLEEVKAKNVWTSAGILAGTALALGGLPLPHRVTAVAQVQPHDAVPVYVEAPGALAEILVRPGQAVVAGQPLVRLDDIELELRLDDLIGQRDKLKTRLASLQAQRSRDDAIAAQLPETEKSLAAIEDQIAQQQAERDKLTLRAQRDGVVWAAPQTAQPPATADQLRTWSGTPLEPRNLRALLPAGTLVCLVGPTTGLRAELFVDQTDIELVDIGQRVDLQFAATPLDRLRGEVTEIAERELEVTPRELSSQYGGDLASRADAAGRERPSSASYQVRVPIKGPPAGLRPGNSGMARIHVGYRTIAARLWRWLRHTFHFRA
jgi:putative peptide zinc metalloprotease protein